ncbi:MAG: hypothetical protein ACI9TH_000707 [Kiritimatiellia bacterium]|jgi:hypothetical protein
MPAEYVGKPVDMEVPQVVKTLLFFMFYVFNMRVHYGC